MLIRPRRNRRTPAIRALTQETRLSNQDLILPLFVHDGSHTIPIDAMPGCFCYTLNHLVEQAKKAWNHGILAIVLFPVIEESLKTNQAQEAYNPKGLIPRCIKALKKAIPDLCVITDVALDPYNADGQDGIVGKNHFGEVSVLNDQTLDILSAQALCHAQAGADIISPSDMMDGRVYSIRLTLDNEGFNQTSILSYTAKYASGFYGPFRSALNSTPSQKLSDKKTYQMNPANAREALLEASLDEQEGADMLMVKPALSNLDIIANLRTHTPLPLAAYQVSGEYLMIKAGSSQGYLDEKTIVLESLTSIKRAGADMILSYYALEACQWLSD